MRTLILRVLGWAKAHRRSLMLLFILALSALLGAHPSAHAADVFNNISPAPQLPPGGWVGRYPVEHYSLDQYFSAISVGFTSGVDTSGVVPMIAYFGAQVLWLLTCFLANGVILLFALAFNLNLLTGNGTPGSGALTPVSTAIHNMYASTFGKPWLIAMVTLLGCWAMWKALVQRRYTETAGALAVSVIYFVLAVGIVSQPERTIGPASKLSNELSTALLSLSNEGSVGSESQAKTAASNQLFQFLVLDPWTVLEFGGIEHCANVSHGKAHSLAVRPLSSNPATDAQLASQLERTSEVKAEGRTCINNREKYAAHFLAYPFQSPRRNREHEALEHGDGNDLPASDAGKTDGTYPLGPADQPAAEAMGKGGQLQRLLLAFVILLGELGAYLLLGALAVGVILAQILLLVTLMLAPAALLIAILPGRGHEFFRAWVAKLVGYLARKVIYSLILAVILAVCSALDDATSNLGWLLAFALQAAFLWTVFLQRNRLISDLLAATVGPRAANDGSSRLANLYYATRLARMAPSVSIPRRSAPKAPAAPRSSRRGAPPGDEAPPREESPEGGPPPPWTGGPSPDLPSGEAQFADEHAAPAMPPRNETPTSVPGAPSPRQSSDPDDPAHGQEEVPSPHSPSEAAPTPALGAVPSTSDPSPARAAAQPPEDELPPAEDETPTHDPPTRTLAKPRSGPGSAKAESVPGSDPRDVPGPAENHPRGLPASPTPAISAPLPEPERGSAHDAGPRVLHTSPEPAAADAPRDDAQPPLATPASAAEEPVEVLLTAAPDRHC